MRKEKKDLKGVITKYKKYGKDCFKKWGKLGGNPALLKTKEENRVGGEQDANRNTR